MTSCKTDMNWWEKFTNMWELTFFHWLMRSWWRNMSDIFYILSIPEIFYCHFIIVKSLLVTLVTCTCAVEFGMYNCPWTVDFPLLRLSSVLDDQECWMMLHITHCQLKSYYILCIFNLSSIYSNKYEGACEGLMVCFKVHKACFRSCKTSFMARKKTHFRYEGIF